jgi:hypothetical protein
MSMASTVIAQRPFRHPRDPKSPPSQTEGWAPAAGDPLCREGRSGDAPLLDGWNDCGGQPEIDVMRLNTEMAVPPMHG